MADDPVAVLDFWLGEVGPEGWYAVDPEVDETIRERFGDLWQAARDGGLDHWTEGTVGSLAFLILTDQFPRNMFRGSAEAFATDPLARDCARKAIAADWDLGAPEPERQFFYLPLEHSEAPEDQAEAVRLFQERMPETGTEGLLHAHAHAAIIARFGRFPFRNAALGRTSTPEEEAFLAEGAYAAEVRRLRG
ncbi:DUF924 family protein [Rhodobacter sphaeroides]|jgi:uncharacterized protein (DUF924 family)|uniref:DUF924 domain-containing protein n=2 Tax=Cereibacter sphaeroides TaxID=1063 RepID=Q3J254_CERS4|nr:DUF924 family protein [Cereibacter sphaeroides]EKX56519.1 Putative transmembrane protein [Rhodobacter sp. AKP1]ABA79130.1 hypothetical protein RSP_2969 [Cereibacter sphaeroides 2.4.1]AMJ47449.1 hypothetical protein APX01_07855 [Cereibacter sphaeroides]ANS34162.1 hypothetical protein A3858_07875 [Cereibacter sphaeroides]ATN63206.1 hypothetical protein A3857_07870 [Cereibacter sphaeroides]